jgi:penicillin V acylase-like amidase (Ntn superfamily)
LPQGLNSDGEKHVTRKVARCLIAILAGVVLFAAEAPACTTFVIRDGGELVLGKNLDWIAGAGLVIVNKRGLAKEGLSNPGEPAAQWVSKYGSITFNQVGRELPYGGMNEAGLVIEQMMLEETVYPEPDERASIGECQWIQFQLGNFATVAEVIESDSLVRISPASTPLHFLVLDACGYISLQRFLVAAAMIDEFGNSEDRDIVGYSFGVLDRVSQGPFTKWSIVYDIPNMRIHFKTSTSPSVKVVEVGDFDYTCASPSMAVGIDLDKKGLINEDFVDYSAAMNREVIFATFRIFREHDFLDVSDSDLEALSYYPDAFECIAY